MKLQNRNREDELEVTLTSLIDVVLLLLVFFMISTSFVQESRIGIRLPEAADGLSMSTEEDPFVISVTAQGTYLVNGRALIDTRATTLEAALRKMAEGKEPGPMTISADANSTHQSVVTALDVAGHLGYTEINISTVKTAEESR